VEPSLLATLLHVAVAFVFVAGLLGRWVLLARARRAEDVEVAHLFAAAAAPFERMVIAGSMLVLPAGLLAGWARGYPLLGLGTGWVLGATILYLSMAPLVPLVYLPRGRVFEAEMAAARAAGAVTPGLRAAFGDRAVSLAHSYELAAVALIVALMVLKPSL
jgi:hypothetical protein